MDKERKDRFGNAAILRELPRRAVPMSRRRIESLDDLTEADRALMTEAFVALRRQRGKAWNAACDIADAAGKRRPSTRSFGIDDIKRLARALRLGPTYWTGEY